MYICYIDESGHCGKKFNPEQPVEVLCGVLTDISKVFKTQKEQQKLIKLLNDNGIPLDELKASEAYRGQKAWKDVKPEIRDVIFEYIFSFMTDRFCKYIVCPIDSKKYFDLLNAKNPTAQKIGYPYEAGALNVIMALQKIHRTKKNNKGKTIVVFDEQTDHDGNILKLFESDLSFSDEFCGFIAKEKRERIDVILDVPFFSKSHLAIIVQLADFTAFVVQRYLLLTTYAHAEKYPGELEKISNWYSKITENTISSSSIAPKGKDTLVSFYATIRPDGWKP
jgi:hypothetical protein